MSSPSLVPAFSSDGSKVYVTSPEGSPALIPTENLADAIGQKFQIGVPQPIFAQHLQSGDAIPGVHVTSPEGKDAILPSTKVHEALTNNGFKIGPSNQQNLDQPPPSTLDNVGSAARDVAINALSPFNPVNYQALPPKTDSKGNIHFPNVLDQAAYEYKQLKAYPLDMLEESATALPRQFANSAQTEGQRAIDAGKAGDVPGAVAHAAYSVVPFFGSQAGDAADQLRAGKYAEGAGTLAGIGLQAASGSPEVAEAMARPVTALTKATGRAVANTGASALSKVLGGGREAMAETPMPQQTAAGPASNAEVAQYAQDKGIDLLPGQATGKRGLKAVQAVGERAVVGDAGLEDHIATQRANFGNLVDDFKSRVAPDVADTETAGQSLQQQTQAGLDKLKQSAQADYQGFQNATGDIPVDLSEVKAKFGQKLADQAEALKNVPLRYATPVKNVLTKLSSIEAGGELDAQKLSDFNNAVNNYGLSADQQAALQKELGITPGGAGVKMSTAQQLRTAYLDISRDYSGNVPKNVQRIAGEAAKDIDSAMATAADKVGAKDQWRQANAKWKQLQDVYNSPESPLYKVLQEPDPSKVPGRLLGKGNYGGSPQTVRQLQAAGIDTAPLKREVTQQIADGNFKLTNGGRGLGGYSSKFLQTLFNPQEFNELTKIGRVGRAINFEMNPSGTSNVRAAEGQLHGIIKGTAGAIVGPAAAKITMSQALRKAAIGELPRTIEGNPSAFDRIVRGGPPPDSTPPPPSGGSTPQTPPEPTPNIPPAATVEPSALQSIVRGGQERRTAVRAVGQSHLPAERIIKQAGLETAPAGGGVNKELGTITFNDLAYPNKPALMNMADVEKLGPEGVKAKMAERLAQQEPPRAEAVAKAAAKAQPVKSVPEQDIAPIYDQHYSGPVDIAKLKSIKDDHALPLKVRDDAKSVYEAIVDSGMSVDSAMRLNATDRLAKVLGGRLNKVVNGHSSPLEDRGVLSPTALQNIIKGKGSK